MSDVAEKFDWDGSLPSAKRKALEPLLKDGASASEAGAVFGVSRNAVKLTTKELYPLTVVCPECGAGHLDTPCSSPCVCRCRRCNALLKHKPAALSQPRKP